MHVTIEKTDLAETAFSPYYELLTSYIESVICIEHEDASLSGNTDDFELLDEIMYHVMDDDFPEEIRKHMISGLGVAFAKILESKLGLEWCQVLDGPFPGFAMRRADSSKVIYPIEMIGKRVVSGEIGFWNDLYDSIKSKHGDAA